MNRIFFISPLILQTAIWPVVRPLFWFFLHLEVRGLEHLLFSKMARSYEDAKTGVIFAVNHSSELDPILVPAALPFLSPLMPFFYTSREQAFYRTSGWRQFFYGGFFFKLWGAHPVRAGRGDYEESLETHIGLLGAGKSVCIFPEGKKTRDGAVGKEARGGVAYLAYRTQAPVVPVRIKRIFKLTLRDFLLRKRVVEVVFGTPLAPAELFQKDEPPTAEEIKSAASRILSAIQRL